MSFESDLVALLDSLAPGRVFWDAFPEGDTVAVDTILLQSLGGREGWYVERDLLPDHAHMRVQVMCFSKHPQNRGDLARAASRKIAQSNFPACEPYGSFISGHNDTFDLYESRQQFGIWYQNPAP